MEMVVEKNCGNKHLKTTMPHIQGVSRL